MQISGHAFPSKLFIGHGRSAQWRELKDHLTDLHQLEVIAYEVGARAGLSIKEVLETMLAQSSIAFLVLTAEDRDEHGNLHARENVIHELGLFQGRLGFTRAIVLLEEGVTEFSNIHGINQIRFRPGRIREAFGDVLATIKRNLVDGGRLDYMHCHSQNDGLTIACTRTHIPLRSTPDGITRTAVLPHAPCSGRFSKSPEATAYSIRIAGCAIL